MVVSGFGLAVSNSCFAHLGCALPKKRSPSAVKVDAAPSVAFGFLTARDLAFSALRN